MWDIVIRWFGNIHVEYKDIGLKELENMSQLSIYRIRISFMLQSGYKNNNIQTRGRDLFPQINPKPPNVSLKRSNAA